MFVTIEILNEGVDRTNSESKALLADWNGFGSIAVAETLRSLMHPFAHRNPEIRIWRDATSSDHLLDYPSTRFLIWNVRVIVGGSPVVMGHILIHKMWHATHSRPLLYYTVSGANLKNGRQSASR